MKQLTFRLKPGELLREEIEKRVQENGVKAGVLLSIVGGLKTAVLRMPGATPENQMVKKLEGPFEVVSGTGTFSQDGCHIHISVSDKEGNVFGGHLKDGCVVSTTAEIVIGVFENVTYKRTPDPATGFPELEIS